MWFQSRSDLNYFQVVGVIVFVISNQPRATRSFDFEITRPITPWIVFLLLISVWRIACEDLNNDSFQQNTIAGRIVYFPIVGRLECGSTSVEHQGYWELWGFGIMAAYKSDWDRFGGECNKNSTLSLYLNFVVFVVKGSCYWTECDGLHFYQRNFKNRYHESFHNVFLSNFSLLFLHR